MTARALWLLLPVLFAGCRSLPRHAGFDKLVEEFVFGSLALAPVTATGAGYHVHEGVRLDELLDDYSPAGLERRRSFYRRFEERLRAEVDFESLSPQQQADYEILENQIALALLELDIIREWRHNPTLYVELIGTALFDPFVREYAPKRERFRHIVARLGRVPALVEQAKANLESAPEIWVAVARQENEGNLRLIDRTLREAVPAELRSLYDQTAITALAALQDFSRWLESDLGRRGRHWRLGREHYGLKFRHALATAATPEAVLAEAEAALDTVRDQMLRIALALEPRRSPPAKGDRAALNRIVAETLNRIAARRSTPASYFADARRDLEEATRFVGERKLVPLPGRDNLQLIETPEFMRGIYAVGGFNPAPALEPHLGAYYWLTPIPADWPQERIDSKLREYNFYGLKLLTLHEAMPGHWVQFEYANQIRPQSRRLLRGIFGNGPYIEGWAVYATEAMLDADYLDGSPELRLTFLKQQLRMIANAILDIRLHTMEMSDEEALELMTRDAFQETEEATAKLRRAKLSSCQLPTYFVGWRDWRRLREHYRRWKGDAFAGAEFHRAALEQGAAPIPVLARLLTGQPLGAR
jgi:uncharacterized protein (DUF885 family)